MNRAPGKLLALLKTKKNFIGSLLLAHLGNGFTKYYGLKVAYIDMDPEHSLSTLLNYQKKDVFFFQNGTSLKALVNKIKELKESYDLILLEPPCFDDLKSLEPLFLADLILIPSGSGIVQDFQWLGLALESYTDAQGKTKFEKNPQQKKLVVRIRRNNYAYYENIEYLLQYTNDVFHHKSLLARTSIYDRDTLFSTYKKRICPFSSEQKYPALHKELWALLEEVASYLLLSKTSFVPSASV